VVRPAASGPSAPEQHRAWAGLAARPGANTGLARSWEQRAGARLALGVG